MAIITADCAACSPLVPEKPTLLCVPKAKTVGTRGIVLFFPCGFVKTNNWATTEDLETDLGNPDVIAVEMSQYGWDADDTEKVDLGLAKISVKQSVTITGTTTNRQADNSDYDMFNSLYDLEDSAQLRIATLSVNGDLRDYSAFYPDMAAFNDLTDTSLEQWKGTIVASAELNSAAGGRAVKPTILVPLVVPPVTGAESAYQTILNLAVRTA